MLTLQECSERIEALEKEVAALKAKNTPPAAKPVAPAAPAPAAK